MTKASLNLQLTGFPAANRDAEITLHNAATGQTITRNPFLDGTLVARDLDAGLWDVKVTHPNLANPIYTGKVRLFPQPVPTRVPIPIPPTIFTDTPIRDIPDANLGPVQQAVTAARDSLGPIGAKAPGEVIRAADWNTLVGVVADLASNVLELTNLLSPRGHDHPEIAEKIAEVQENIRNFTEAFGRSLLEWRRELETESIRTIVTSVLDEAQAPQATRDELLGRVTRLTESVQADPTIFTGQLVNASNRALAVVNDFIAAKPELANSANVQALQSVAQVYSNAGTATKADTELKIYNRSGSALGSKFSKVVARG
jgi:hypothetical protein